MKKLKDAQNYLYENKNLNKCAYIDLPVFDLREGRTFKRYIHFLIKAGIIENETITLHYLYDVRTFCKILIMVESLAKYYCLKADEIIDLTKTLELFLKEIKPQEEKLAAEYLSDSTVSKVKHKKNYYC